MKKHLLSLFAMASMVFASSCTSEEIVSQSTGNEVAVTFTADLRNDVKSRAVGDDTGGINELVFAVYDENHELLPSLTQKVSTKQITLSAVNNEGQRTATINVVLVKGQTYSFAFWAQDKDYTAYRFNETTATVSIEYGQTANNKNADAFFAKINDYTVTGSFEQKVTLKRPFAQVNFLTTDDDLNKAKAAGFEPDQSSIIVQNAATSLNVLTGEVSGDMEAKFELADWIKSEKTTIKDANGAEIKFGDSQNATTFKYLATAYFLPTSDVNDVEITASMSAIQSDKSSKAPVELTAPKVKAKRNYRTNIYGNLLTSNGTFYVTVDPGFDGDYSDELEDPTTIVVATVAEANALFEGGITNVTIQEAPTTAAEATINLPDTEEKVTIYFAFDENAAPEPITIEYPANPTKKPENIEVNGDAGDLIIDAPESTVTLNGNYESVVSTTANNTLVVTKGTKIKNLAVKQGNVRIEDGAEVTNIVRKDNEDTITYVIYEGTLPTEANEDELIVYISASEFKLIDVAANGGEVRLTTNVELTRPLIIAATADATIDLNGCTISQVQEQNAAYSMIQNNGTLTIKDTKGSGEISYADNGNGGEYVSNTIVNNGTLIIESGIIENNSSKTVAANGYPHPIDNNANLTINGGTITNNANYSSMRIWCTTDDNTLVTINGGTFNGSIDFQTPNTAANKGTLTINDGTFNADTYTKCAVRLLGFGADVDEMNAYIKGGNFKGEIALRNWSGSEFNSQVFFISGGTFSNNPSTFLELGYKAVEQEGTYIIEGDIVAKIGTTEYSTLQKAINAANNGEKIVLLKDLGQKDGVLITDKNITIDLNGKTFAVSEGANTNNRNFKINGSSVVTIKNGTLIANGELTSGAYGTVRTEGTANVTLEDVKLYSYRGYGLNVKANSGTTITINDSEIYSQYSGGVEAAGGTIELNDVTIDQKGVYSGAAWCSVAIGVNGGGKVTVNSGNYSASTISTDSNAAQGTWVAYVMSSGGTLEINGGTFNGTVAETAAAANACGIICADRAAVVTINGGTFESNGAILDMRNNDGSLPNPIATLAGGTFSADPRDSGLYSSNLISVADGYEVVENEDGTWTVEEYIPTAKVGNTEYGSIEEAIAAWTHNTTLTLLKDVELKDVIKLKSTEYHILDLGTYTMTGAKSKNAIEIINEGRSSASYALDIKANAINPGGITASSAIVKTTGKSGVKDRPIIRFYNGVFNASNIINHGGSSGTNSPQFIFYNGVYNGNITTNRAICIFEGGTFNGRFFMSVDSSSYARIGGGKFKYMDNLYGSALNADKFTIGSAKGVFDRGVYVDDEGYIVVGGPVITEFGDKFAAKATNASKTGSYLPYSSAAANGLYYTNAEAAIKKHGEANVVLK